ncbi:hypothetical protein PIB30_032845 [Stylosanthes scabra]|uniref:Uncharacterized protein n=1 Tax=Stylosanthes scabra TaxID=79078 RepID=A0ABU6QCG0_9FABA|nr:hypothetical protein [Stylosanthes scabra]
MIVKEAQVRRNMVKGWEDMSKKWVRKTNDVQPKMEPQKIEKRKIPKAPKEQTKTKREVEVMVAKKQRELLDRSILTESFEPIRFGSVVERWDKLEEQYGKIEFRDLGPRKCILSMDTIELWGKALSDAIFLEIFDEEFSGEVLTRQVHPDYTESEHTVVENSVSNSMASIHGDHAKSQEAEVLPDEG